MTGPHPVLRSAAYTVAVHHERLWPKRHAFTYRLFYLALDLDELPALDGPVLRVNRRGLMSVHERDYFRTTEAADAEAAPRLKARVAAWCAGEGFALPADARVTLVTLPRVLGYAFNPVSFYFCCDAENRPLIAVAEVTNTFREVKRFLVPPVAGSGAPRFRACVPKDFYVSPFSPTEAAFEFVLRFPAEQLALGVDHFEVGRRTLRSALVGHRRPWSQWQLLRLWFRYPLLSVAVIARIHWQALRLWAKRVPWFCRLGPRHRSPASSAPRAVSA